MSNEALKVLNAFPPQRLACGSPAAMLRLCALPIAVAVVLGTFATPAAHAVDPAVLEAQQQRVETLARLEPTVTAVFGAAGGGGGSGVVISADGYALTNFHVTSGAGNFMKCGLSDGKLYDAVIVGIDPTGDVALIKLLGRDDFPHATLGDSDKLAVGDWTYVIGNPFLLATDFRPTVTFGIVSGVHRYQYPAGSFLEYTDCIQVDTSINPGNSGGPLFNSDGELVGINGRGSFEKRGRVNSGAGYAISINQIKNFMDHLRSGRIVDHATLGATVGTQRDGSVMVESILEQSEAYRRGLRSGDELVAFAGRPIRSVNQFKNILGIYPKGWKLPLVYRNEEGKKTEIHIRLRGLHSQSEMTLPTEGQPRRPQNPDREQPKDNDPDKKDPNPPPPDKKTPLPELPFHAEPQPPEEYKNLYVPQPGFANYYFNQLEQDRTLKALELFGDFSAARGAWRLAGTTAANQPFEFILTDQALGLNLGKTPYFLELNQDPIDEPPGTGGLLIAMHHLRLLLARGADAFTEFYYVGSEPLDGRFEQVDVISASLAGVETRWYFSRAEQTLVGFDTFLTADADACEVRIETTAEFGNRNLPSIFSVRHGEQDIAIFSIGDASLSAMSAGSGVPQ